MSLENKVFFSNYDLYESDTGPGAGWNSMQNYKSIKEFLKKKKKRRKKSQQIRMFIFKKALENFNGSIGLTGYFPNNDFEDKSPDELNLGKDYQENDKKSIKTKPLSPQPAPLLGIPDGVEEEEKDADKTINKTNPYYGITNLHNFTYDKL